MSRGEEMTGCEAQDFAPETLSDGPINLVHLARYTLGNRSLQTEVLGLFLMQADTYLQRLREASDAKSWIDAAHTLKGTARSIGATQVAECAEAAEQLSGGVSDENHQDALRDLAHLVDEANKSIENILAQSSISD